MNKKMLEFIPDILRDFYAEHLRRAAGGVGIWSHDYECSSASEFRIYRLQACNLSDTGEVVICHSLVTARRHSRVAVPRAVIQPEVVEMCSHCRCARNDSENDAWLWVPEFVTSPPAKRVDSLCPRCADYYERGIPPWPDGG